MKDIRIGNDINVKWSIFGDDAPYILEGKDVSLYLCTPFGKRKAEGFSIVGNQITWTFAGKDQSRTGKYSLELVVNADKEGQVTTDACNFVNLVNCSCKVGGADESNVEIESIELTSELGFLPYDDTEIRNEIKKKQDALVSGKNIKTINGQSLLGEGNIVIEGGGGSYDDAGIKKDISDLKENDALQDAELAKLSAEVGKLGKPIFKAIYGETKIEDVIAAYESGIVVHCDYNNYCYVLSRLLGGEAYFSAVDGQITSRLFCSKNSNWSVRSFTVEQTANKVTSLSSASTDTQYPSAKAVFMAISNIGGKQGVIRQTQTWTQAADKSYSYVMSDIVRGVIPQANMDLFISAGSVFNEESGYFELNGLTDISYEEMAAIYAQTKMFVRRQDLMGAFSSATCRTNYILFDFNNGSYGNSISYIPILDGLSSHSKLEVIAWQNDGIQDTLGAVLYNKPSRISQCCFNAYYVRKIQGYINMDAKPAVYLPFENAYSLEEVRLLKLKTDLDMKKCSRLSNDSILYMIQNEAATSAIVITLHADAYDRAMADAEITAALAAHPNVSLAK